MNKTKLDVYRELLRDVSQNFEGAENVIKQRIEKICERKNKSVEEVFYFHISLVFFIS